MSDTNMTVTDNPEEQRYEVHLNGTVAVLEYERSDGQIALIHTEVPDSLSGHGIAGALAKTALDDARAQHVTVLPLCEFVAAYIKRHPQEADVLSPSERERLLNS